MKILNKTLTVGGNNKKDPVKIKVKTSYRITIMVNNNDVMVGTHAGMLLISPKGFEIFDPNGSFYYPEIAEGRLRLFPVYEPQKRADVYRSYLEYQLADGGEVYIYTFYLSKDEFLKIEDRILNEEGCSGILSCSRCTSNAITGIGVFKNLPPDIFLPFKLKKELDKIANPIKILRNKP